MEPIKFTVEFELKDESELFEYIKVATYKTEISKTLGLALLKHFGIERFVEVMLPYKILPTKNSKYLSPNEDLPF